MSERLLDYRPATAADAQQRIGGWLAFFGVTCSIGLLYLLLYTIKARELSTILIDLLLIVTTALLVICLFTRSQLVFATLWGQSVIRLCVLVYNLHLAWLLYQRGVQQKAANIAYAQCASISIVIFWLLYFRFSKRVLHTFGRNL